MNLFEFRKYQRLVLRRDIETLFRKGKAFSSGPLRIIYRIADKTGPAAIKVLISVPRKKFPGAVTRNKIRRLIREAYRLNRNSIIPDDRRISSCIHAGLIYTGDNSAPSFKEVEGWVREALIMLENETSILKGSV